MTTIQRRPQCLPTFLILAVLGLSDTSNGAERDPDALPNGAVARLGWSPLRIGSDSAFAFAPDNRTIVVVTPQGNFRRLNAQTGRLLERRQLTDRSDVDPLADGSVQLSVDGQTVAIYESSYTGPRVTVYEAASGKKIFRRASTETKRLISGKLSPNGKQLAIVEGQFGAGERNLRLIDLPTGRLREMGIFGPYEIGMSFSADGKRLLVSQPLPQQNRSRDAKSRTFVSFDLASGKKIGRRNAGDSRTLLTNAQRLQRWALTIGKSVFTAPDGSQPEHLMQLAFAPHGKEVFASSDKGLSKWDLTTGKRIDLIRDKHGFASLFFRTPDGIRAIRDDYREERFEFTVFDPVAHQTLHTIRWNAPHMLGVPRIDAVSLTANGKALLAIYQGNGSRHAAAWDVATGRKLSDFPVRTDYWLAGSPFSPCGRWVLLHDKLYHVGSGTELFEPSDFSDEWMGYSDQSRVLFSEDGRLMAAPLWKFQGKGPAAHTLAVWELASGQILARFPKPGFVAEAAFAPDGRTIALVDAQGIRLEDLLSGKRLARYPAPDVICGTNGRRWGQQGLVFAPDGGTLATGHRDGTILLWKVPQSHPAPPVALADGEAENLWTDLGSPSPVTARTAVDRLARHPDGATVLLTRHFRPPPIDAKLAALISDLDSDEFASREAASHKLRAYGAKAETALWRILQKNPSLEMRRRIQDLLAGKARPPLRLPLSGERLRGVRAIEVLERAGNAAARSLLQSWVEQSEDVQLAIEARMALERLGQ